MRQSGQIAKYSAAEPSRVKMVEFSSFSKQELQAWSVVQITQSRLYEGNRPVPGSPNDLRLGVSTMDQKCQTCGETRQCQGHFGHIKLCEPVFHYGFMKYVQKILKCVCHHCHKLKIFKNDYQRIKFLKILKITNPVKRLSEAAKILGHISKCGQSQNAIEQQNKIGNFCGSIIPTKIQLRNHKMFINDRSYDSRQIYKILSGISRQDAKALGFTKSKPVNLMIQTLAVGPPQIRPSIQMNPQKRAQDDITSAYVRIVAINNEIKNNKIQSSQKTQKIQEMQRIVASIMVKLERVQMEKTVGGRKKKVMKHIKSIEERLKGKEGRFRQNLMGKRVDFSARSVISPDACLDLDQLGVPQKVARSLTVPEEITEWNYERIVKLCRQGKVKYLLKPNDEKRNYEDVINFVKLHDADEIQKYLNYGMVVERCLQNGDYVLFNRQPTLHRMSMMGHRVRILPYNTFRLNLSVCTPYNADFDGDQMNMHVPQSYETISQIKHIAHVPKQIVAPKNNAPVMGIVQDALLGLYLFSMRDTFLTKEQIMNLAIWIQYRQNRSSNGQDQLLPGQLPQPAILKPEPLWTGKQVMSMIIPDKITIQIMKESDVENGLRNIKDTNMIIRKGQLLSGALQKQIVGSGPGGLVHSIWLQIGSQATAQFMTTSQRIVNHWLLQNGFTVGASDIVLSKDLQEKIQQDHRSIIKMYYQTFNNYRNQKIIEEKTLHQRGKKIMDSFDFFVNSQLNSKLGGFQKVVSQKVSPYLNNIFKMITAKSKGSQTNLAQIMFSLGNQNVDGKRVPLGFAKRSLPHFTKDDNTPQSRGFVFSSFYKGLKPHEFFFHSMGGRQGLSDTAVKTARTGYIQRKLVKSLQDIVIKYDGTVRDSSNNMLQKLYGQDSFMGEYIQKQKAPGIDLSLDDFRRKFGWQQNLLINKYKYSPQIQIPTLNQQLDHLIYSRDRLRQIFIQGKDSTDIEYYCPIKIQRLINKIKAGVKSSRMNANKQQTAKPLFVYEKVQQLIDECIPPQSCKQYRELLTKYSGTVLSQKKKRDFIQKKREFERQNGIQLFRIHLRMHLASRPLIDYYKLSENLVFGLIEEIKTKFYQSLAPAGQAIGSIAAQSIGQPTTQMTLNTFHLAGVADKNVTLGVPRLQELLDTSKNIRTPNMTIFLKDRIKYKDRGLHSNILASMISFYFPQRYIKDFISSSKIYYDPYPQQSNIGARYKQMSQFKRTPWVLAVEFSNKKLTSQIQWQEISQKLQAEYENKFEINEERGFRDFQDQQPLFTLRLLNADFKTGQNTNIDKCYAYLLQVQQNIRNIFISGIKGVHTVKTSKRLMFAPVHKDKIDKKNKQDFQYVVLQTDGSNLKKCLSHFKIDSEKTYSNDMIQIYRVLGIQAARQSFINQFKQIIKPYGIYINHRHLCVLADWMTTRGILTPVNRNGINRVRDVSVLRKASYQQTTDILFSAAVFSEVDAMRGVSERIIFGQNVNIGTGSFNIMVDRDQVKQYNAKGKKDKQQMDEKMELYMNYDDRQFGLDKTPILNTPGIFGRSMHVANSPNIFGGGGSSMKSPLFTPMRSYHKQQFTQEYQPDLSVMHSPGLGGQTPLPFNQISSTPLAPSASPVYGIGMSSVNRMQSTYLRSPHYNMNYNMGTSSPNYSSSARSRSPDYNTPASNRHGSPNSPSYSPTPINSNRAPKDEQDEQEDDL